MSQSSPYKSSYRTEVDGLKAFAVLSVVAFHAFPSLLKGGFIGVDVFFVISGFLITSHIFEKLDKGQFSFTDFFGRRIRRLFPALILIMICSLAFGWFALLADEFAQLGKHVASGVALIANFILVDEGGYFDNAAETKPMLHLWSLAVEEQFYIVWTLVLWLAWKRKFNLLTITILVAVVSFYLNLRFVKSHPTEIFFWSVGRLWEPLSGSVLAWLLLYKSDELSRLKLWIDKSLVRTNDTEQVEADGSTTSNLMSFFGLLLLGYGVIRIDDSLSYPSKWALIPVLGALLIIASGSKAWLNRIFLMNLIAVWFGLISYPLYLWHWPILSFLQIFEGDIPHRDARITAVLLSIFLAWITYRFVERPIRFGARKDVKSVLLIGLIAVVGSLGFWAQKNGGLTPFNQKMQRISDAKSDWDYPNGLIRGGVSGVFYTSKKSVEVVFLGDSHMEQYGPRVVDLYADGESKEAAFITGGGCPPIPNLVKAEERLRKRCSKLLKRFEAVLNENNVKTVVIGASFNGYFSGEHQNTYYNKGELIAKLSTEEGVKLAKASFYEFVSKLTEKYRVVVLLGMPTDKKFDPNTLLNADGVRRSIPLGIDESSISFTQADYQIRLSNEMKNRLSELKVVAVDQAAVICPNKLCRSINERGQPIYKDNGHMRPFFVKEHMDLVDPFFRLPH